MGGEGNGESETHAEMHTQRNAPLRLRRLCDFGTAVHVGSSGRALTRTGTWEYAAPEQLEGRGATMAADWWALGIVCFECLADGLPFPFAEGDTTQSPAHVLQGIKRRCAAPHCPAPRAPRPSPYAPRPAPLVPPTRLAAPHPPPRPRASPLMCRRCRRRRRPHRS